MAKDLTYIGPKILVYNKWNTVNSYEKLDVDAYRIKGAADTVTAVIGKTSRAKEILKTEGDLSLVWIESSNEIEGNKRKYIKTRFAQHRPTASFLSYYDVASSNLFDTAKEADIFISRDKGAAHFYCGVEWRTIE